MKRKTRLVILGLLAVGLVGLGAARKSAFVSSAGQATRAFGDLTADWGAVTAPPYSAYERRMAAWPLADLSNSGDLIVYAHQLERFSWTTRITRLPGGEIAVDSLLPSEAFGGPVGPRFSPDGKQVAFCAAGPGDPPGKGSVRPWLVNSDGTGLSRLRDDAYNYASPAWRPDGKQVALYRHSADGSIEEIVFLDPHTGEVLSTLKPDLSVLRFSPDGQWLLGRKVVPPNTERLVALNLRTNEERVVWDPTPLGQPGSDDAWWVVNYAWAFDSRRIFFTAYHRDWELPQGPSASEMWEGSLDGPAGKIMDGQVLAGSLNGKYLLIDKRRVPSRDELSSGDVQLLTLKPS